jgi:ABC-type nitrate/sulfonate/bicarbonate transport system substrate-binding protein
VLDAALSAAGLDRDAVTRQRVTSARLATVWESGGAEAVIAYSPVIEQFEAGGARVLFSTHDAPGLVMDVLAARPGLREDPRVEAVLQAWDDGVAQLARDEATVLGTLARGFGLDLATYREALSKVALLRSREGRALLVGNPPPILATVRRVEPLVRADRERSSPRTPGAAP